MRAACANLLLGASHGSPKFGNLGKVFDQVVIRVFLQVTKKIQGDA